MTDLFTDRRPLPDALDDTRHRLSLVARQAILYENVNNLFAEVRRARRLGHLQALRMPDGIGKTPLDMAGSHHAICCMTWATVLLPDIRRRPVVLTLQTLAYLQLSTSDMLVTRTLAMPSYRLHLKREC
jgi:hypothetical protein